MGSPRAAHPARAAIAEAVRARPGITTAELAARTGRNAGTLAHHLRALQKAGLVKRLRVGRNLTWFDASAPRVAMEPPERRALLAAVERAPGATQADLSRATGLGKATVHHHVSQLARAGAVDVRREGRSTRLFALRPHEHL